MIKRFFKDNQSALLVVGASVGVLSTAYLTGRASFQAAHVLSEDSTHRSTEDRVRLVWKLYIPAGASAATTILLVTGIRHVDGRRILAANTALAVSQRAYEGYREQVIEELGEKKDQTFLAKVAEKRVNESVPLRPDMIVGSGSVMCCELYTGRYFMSDMESINRAVNEINSRLNKHDYATLDDFYYEVGLENTTTSGQTGWESPKLMELEFSSVLSQGKPCLAFDYNYVKAF